jgi:hypothetical protein
MIVLVGLGIVFWLFLKEQQKESKKTEKKNIPSLLARLGLQDSGTKQNSPQPSVSRILTMQTEEPPTALKGTFEPPHTQENISKGAESAATIPFDLELPAKYLKLEQILQEKTEELEKKEKALANELKTRKEFNKVKDILEKELKDIRDKNHQLQLELGASQAEVENYKKHIIQLEDKIKTKEQEIKQKEGEINDLVKRIQVFATPQSTKEEKLASQPPPTEIKPEVKAAEIKDEGSKPQISPEEIKKVEIKEEQSAPQAPPPAIKPEVKEPQIQQEVVTLESKDSETQQPSTQQQEKKIAQGEPLRQPRRSSQ